MQPGHIIAHYRIEEKLGQGGMGVVYKAHDTKLDRTVALKFLPSQLSTDDEAKARFMQEARAASALEDDNICTIYEIGSSEGQMYISMAYYGGEALNVRLARSGALPLREALSVGRQLAAGLSAAHSHDIVHRDIKPGNVILTERGRVKILDFGLAKLGKSADLTKAGSTLGTASYMSPEQVRGEAATSAADVWALGIMLFELFTGRKPFAGDYEQAVLYAILNEEPVRVETLQADVPEAVADLIGACLQKDARMRPSADEVLQVLAAETPGWAPETLSGDALGAESVWYHEPWKVAAAFGGFALVVMVLVYTSVMQFGLPDWVLLVAIILIVAGLPVVLYAGHLERKRAASSQFRRAQGVGRIVTWRNAWYGGLLAFSCLGVVAAAYMVMRLAGIGPAATLVSSGVLSENDRIILAEFDNRTDDPGLAASITEALRIDLGQSPVISLLDRSEVEAALTRMNAAPTTELTSSLARDLALRNGLKAVVEGEVGRLGAGFVISASVVSTDDGKTLVSMRETAEDENGIIGAVDRLSASLREEIGESLKTIRATPSLERVTTSSLQALRKYTAAETSIGDRAVDLLKEAIALDTTFAMAYRKLAVALGNAGGDYGERIRAARKAYELRSRLPTQERYQAEAYFFYDVEFDPEKAAAAYRSILEIDPNDYIALNNLAIILQRKGQLEQAAELYRRSVDERPNGFVSWTNLVGILPQIGKIDGAWAAAAEYKDNNGPGAEASWLRMEIFSELREPDSVTATLGPWLNHEDKAVRWWVTRFRYAGLTATGHLAEADELLHQLDNLSEERGLPEWRLVARLDRAIRQVVLFGDRRAAMKAIDEALSDVPMDSMPPLNRPYDRVAQALAIAGDPRRAEGYLNEYERVVPTGIRAANEYRHNAYAAVAIAEGRYEDAIKHYDDLDAQCRGCGSPYDLALAQQLAGDTEAAFRTLERLDGPGSWDSVDQERFTLGPAYRMLGELYEDHSDIDDAIRYYEKFTDLWKNADASLQPQVAEVQKRIDDLLRRSAQEPGA